MICGVIFDLDGVLVATDGLHTRAWRQVATEAGLNVNKALLERLRGRGRMASLDLLLEANGRSWTSPERRRLAERKNDLFYDLAQGLGPGDATPGAVDLIRSLRARDIRLAVGSSSRNAVMVLERLGLAEFFETICDRNDVGASKPEPHVFLLASERLGLAPGDCVVIEDAPAGIEAARRAGMAVVGIGSAEQLAQADRVYTELAEIGVEDLLAATGA